MGEYIYLFWNTFYFSVEYDWYYQIIFNTAGQNFISMFE